MDKFYATDQPPPTINVNRDLTIPDTTAIGTVIAHAQAITDENIDFKFGLEKLDGLFRNQNQSEHLPFTINEQTGEVSTNQSLIKLVKFVISTFHLHLDS